MVGSRKFEQEYKPLFDMESWYWQILDTINEGVAIVSATGQILTWNRGAEVIFGISARDAICMNLHNEGWNFLFEDGTKCDIKELPFSKTLKTGRPVINEKIGFHRTPEDIRWLSVNTHPLLRNGEKSPYAVAVSFSDITDLKIEKDASQNYLDVAGVMILALNEKGEVTLINRKGCEILGGVEKDFIGKNWFDLFTPKDIIDDVKKSYKELIAGRTEVTDYAEFRFITLSGVEKAIAWHNTILRDKDGIIIGTLSSGEDITERKDAEKRLKESEEKLLRSKKMESLGLLAGGVAHDLNNVLSGIVSYPEILLMDLPNNSKFRKPVETIHNSGKRAAAIVQDLLTIARGVASQKGPLNLNEIIHEYMASPELKNLMHDHPGVVIREDISKELNNIYGSQIHIRKVIMNLVSNAVEAIKGRGKVTVSTFNLSVTSPLKGYDDIKEGEYTVLKVTDNGAGIQAQHMERIFEPFFSKKVMGRSGTGLGLAVVWNIVQDHNGHINITSDERGTTFEIYLPATKNETVVSDGPISIERLKGRGERVLVIDDEESLREITCRMLEKLNYRAEAASSGEEAIRYLHKQSADIVLLDMIMTKGMNGRMTYEKILEINPKQKAIIVSGFAETEEVKKTQRLGAGRYIRKPYTLETIGLAIKEALN